MNHVHLWHIDAFGVGYCNCDPLALRQFRDWQEPAPLYSWNAVGFARSERLQLPTIEDEGYG